MSIFTTLASCAVIWSAKVPSPVRLIATEPSPRVAFGLSIVSASSEHRFDWPLRHQKQWPHAGTNDAITWSPTLTRVTSDPTHSMTPVPSWPRMHGGGIAMVPFAAERSEWHTPLAPIRTTTSLGPGSTGVTSSTDSSVSPVKMAARIGSSRCRKRVRARRPYAIADPPVGLHLAERTGPLTSRS